MQYTTVTHFHTVFRRVLKIEKTDLTSSCLFVRPHATTWLPLDGSSSNLKFDDFSKTCRET